MINLGRNSGKDMPPVYLEPQTIDRIFEGISILVLTATWVLSIIFYLEQSSYGGRLFVIPGVMTFITVLLLWSSRASIRYYNFPVKLTQQNYVWQYRIATAFVRIINVVVNLLLLLGLLSEIESFLEVRVGIFRLLIFIVVGIFLILFIFYYITAFRYR